MQWQWVRITGSAAFAPRDGAGGVVHKGKMWLLGGWNPADKTHFPLVCNNEVWSSKDGAAWAVEKSNTFLTGQFDPERDWEGRHTAGYVVFKNRMWIIGGDPIQKHYQNDVWSSADGRHWQCVTREVPWGPRVLHHTVAFKDRIWVMGGQTLPQFAPAKECFYDDVWSSTDGLAWEKMDVRQPAWPSRGMIGGNVVFMERMWILGGGTYETPQTPERKFYNDVWSSNDGVHWRCHLRRTPWHPRQYHEVAVFDNRMWVLGGWNKANRNDVWYSADGAEWRVLPGTPWPARHAASVFVHNDALWVVAGNNMTSDAWKLVRT